MESGAENPPSEAESSHGSESGPKDARLAALNKKQKKAITKVKKNAVHGNAHGRAKEVRASSAKNRYKKILYKGFTYCVGEVLLLKESEHKSLIGKLEEILPEGGKKEYPEWPTIRVCWYYSKEDLDMKKLGISKQD